MIAHALGVIRAVFVAEAWLPAMHEAFGAYGPEREASRWGFIGRPAEPALWSGLVGKAIPPHPRGSGNPISYIGV